MKKRINTIMFITAILLFSLITGCINIDYTGQRFPETENMHAIEFFNSSKDVPAGKYTIIGRAVATAPDSYSSEEIKNKLLSKAQACGADAIQVVDFKRIFVSQQAIPKESAYDNGPVGVWGNRARRADGSSIAVDSSGKVVPLQSKVHDRYELKARVLFLRIKSKSNIQEPIAEKVAEPEIKSATAGTVKKPGKTADKPVAK
ncbi:MAG: hypothetical protein L3J71_12700 [Victivallaceae bacterium]|nr:hypothetical protein [Victivallaceae bacterium]